MKIHWLFKRILFSIKQTPHRVWRVFVFKNYKFYQGYSFLTQLAAWFLLISDALFVFDFFEILTNLFSPNTRRLTKLEILRGQQVFGQIIDFELVMLDKRSEFVRRGAAHAYVTFNTVNCFKPIAADIFIHELTHIFQYQNFGAGYIALALSAQKSAAGYNYAHTQDWRQAQSIFDFNAEQQADLFQDYYRMKTQKKPAQWRAVFYNDAEILEKLCKNAIEKSINLKISD